MQQLQSEPDESSPAPETSGFQLTLELLILLGIGALIFVTAARIPAARSDAAIILGIGVVMHAAALVRLAVRAADFAEHDAAE